MHIHTHTHTHTIYIYIYIHKQDGLTPLHEAVIEKQARVRKSQGPSMFTTGHGLSTTSRDCTLTFENLPLCDSSRMTNRLCAFTCPRCVLTCPRYVLICPRCVLMCAYVP